MFRQVALLKKRTKGLPDGALEGDVNQAENAPESSTQSPSKDPGDEPKATEGREIRLIYFVLSGSSHAFMFLIAALYFLIRRGQQ